MRQTGDNLRKGSTITCHLFGIEKKKNKTEQIYQQNKDDHIG